MKGFIHLVEIAIATILVAVVLAALFSVRTKESWEVSDIIAIGNNMMNYISRDDSYFLNILNENLDMINKIKPAHIKYGLEVLGSPKSLILVGCVNPISCNYTTTLLDPIYINNRWINFSIENFNINMLSQIPYIYDAVIFVGYINYTLNKQKINDYLNRGGAVIGINATINNNDQDFNDIFNLTHSMGSGNLYFGPYDIYQNKVLKYFLGFGFTADTEWYIWEDEWRVSYGSNYANLTKVSDGTERNFLNEGETFDLVGPDSNNYYFKIRKIWPGQKVDFQPLGTGFIFKDFSENNCRGNNILSNSLGTVAGMTINNSAIWISDFPKSDEYETLVKAAIAASTDDWIARNIETTRELIKISSFVSLCCDMPEVTELVLSLSYIL
jgi:hypothetical protein